MDKKIMTTSFSIVVDITRFFLRASLFDRRGQLLEQFQRDITLTTPFPKCIGINPTTVRYLLRSTLQELFQKHPSSKEALSGLTLIIPANWCLIWDKVTGTPLTPILIHYNQNQSLTAFKRTYKEEPNDSAGAKWEFLIKQTSGSNLVCGQLSDWLQFELTEKVACFTQIGYAAETGLTTPSFLNWDIGLLTDYNLPHESLLPIEQAAKSIGIISGFDPIPNGTRLLATSAQQHVIGLGLGLWHYGDIALIHRPQYPHDLFLCHIANQTVMGTHRSAPVFPPHSVSTKFRKQLELYLKFPWALSKFFSIKQDKWATDSNGIFVHHKHNKFGMFGLDVHHQPSEISRAFYEGMACITKEYLTTFQSETSIAPKSLHLVGPFESNYVQLLSDVLQIPVHFFGPSPLVPEGGFQLGRHIFNLETRQPEHFQPQKPQISAYPAMDPLTSENLFGAWKDSH